MEQNVKKLKTVDVDYYDKHSNEDNLFFDVIEHRFEDDFLVISRYREYSDGVPRKVDEYIPKSSIARITVYQEKNDYVPQGDIIQLTRLVNGEQEGSWYE